VSLQELQDRLDIEDLPKRYAMALDARDWVAVDGCFMADADVQGTTLQGKYPDYVANLRRVVEQFHTTMHFLGTQLTVVDGDVGRVTTYCIAFHLGVGIEELVVGVQYHDEVMRVDGGWKISKRRVDGVWSRALSGEIKDLVALR